MKFDTGILNISIFGSYGRGGHDAFSDLDVLVVCRDGAGTQSEGSVRAIVSPWFDQSPSISWYGNKKMEHFFEDGDLFAWHLYMESYALPGYLSISEMYGRPARYINCLDDIRGLHNILRSVPGHIAQSPHNVIYELGIAYVCLRNIAMTASSVLCEKVLFGRNSPFELPEIDPPVTKEDYSILAQCRHASTRGAEAPPLNIDVSAVLRDSLTWAKAVERRTL
ncbi:nucleotidyltransferase domain-containing protein [Paracoccus sp. NFXS7]|uniref:nucleotidyltransferase domain-containing protein n=1 Tax=Paracoccus sp. NFXS7 TaxID=2908653 RepID=UPI0032DFB67E